MKTDSHSSACRRWAARAMTDTLEGTAGVIDHYARGVEVSSGHDGDAVFRDLSDRLLTYRIFPPSVLRADVCSIDGRIREGTTIVQRVAIGPFPLESAVR